MDSEWLRRLDKAIRAKRLALIQFEAADWSNLKQSRHGFNRFTIARAHEAFGHLKAPTACLMFGKDRNQAQAYFGLIKSRSPVSTLESRIKITRAQRVRPSRAVDLLNLVTERRHITRLKSELELNQWIVVLPPMLSSHLVHRLSEIPENRGPMRSISEAMSSPKHMRGPEALQENAIHTALRAFGLSNDDGAISLDLFRNQETGLARINIREDAVIEHDARHIPGFDLVTSDLTGRAVFVQGGEKLEVFTANRRPLEKVFGVDLIYLNTVRENVVMLQYKMLEPPANPSEEDWIYRPDNQLEEEIERMNRFDAEFAPGQLDYRINSQVFYLRFVKRTATEKNSGITMPIDHFDRLRSDPSCKGPRGGFRISYKSLNGRYLRQTPFLDLLKSGYIGAHAEKTNQLSELIQATLLNDKAVVGAIQQSTE